MNEQTFCVRVRNHRNRLTQPRDSLNPKKELLVSVVGKSSAD